MVSNGLRWRRSVSPTGNRGCFATRWISFTDLEWCTAAKAALRRKKQHEHTLDQTVAQISTLEQQIYSIEAANINRETLAAMEKAGAAMKQIHGKLNIDTVDETMYVDELHYPARVLIQPLIHHV